MSNRASKLSKKQRRNVEGSHSVLRSVREAEIARKVAAHVNLIPVNPVTETGFKPTSGKETNAFKQALEQRGVNSTVRREMGRDIDGACGQLRKRKLDEK